MSLQKTAIDREEVLSQAFLNAGADLGLSQSVLGRIVGRDRTRLKAGIDPDSKPGELALLFIRIYRALYALLDGDRAVMKHWMHTENSGTRGQPAVQVQQAHGLVEVLNYLDAMRGKI